MSLTATLLLKKPISFPDGVKRPPHYIDRPVPLVVNVEADYRKRRAQREANIANVLAAIKGGVATVNAIAEHLGISKTTALKSVNRLRERGQIKSTARKMRGVKSTNHWRVVPGSVPPGPHKGRW